MDQNISLTSNDDHYKIKEVEQVHKSGSQLYKLWTTLPEVWSLGSDNSKKKNRKLETRPSD